MDRAALTSSLKYDRSGFDLPSDAKLFLVFESVQQTENTPLQCENVCSTLRRNYGVTCQCERLPETYGCRVSLTLECNDGYPALLQSEKTTLELEFKGRAFAILWSATTTFRPSSDESFLCVSPFILGGLNVFAVCKGISALATLTASYLEETP